MVLQGPLLHDLPTGVPRGAPLLFQGAFPLSLDLLGAEAEAGELISAWERSWLCGGGLWRQEISPWARSLGQGRYAAPQPRSRLLVSHTRHRVGTGAVLSAVSEVPREPAGGQLGDGRGSEGALQGRRGAGLRPQGRVPQVLLCRDAAVAPTLQDRLLEGRALREARLGRQSIHVESRLGRGRTGGG